jgi:DNA-binding transcriptional LysR family regulator
MFELRHLRCFVAVAEELHFGRAALRLRVAQPALSQQLQRIEASLGVRLFDRTKRKVELTTAGRHLLEEARSILSAAERAERNVRRASKGELGTLRLGFVGTGAFGILPGIIRRFHTSRPDVKIEFHDGHVENPFDLLEAGALDVAIIRAPVSHPRLTIEPFYSEPVCAVVPRAHPLGRRHRIRLGALASEPFVLFPRRNQPEFHDAITSACRACGFSPRVENEAGDWQVLVSLVAAGLGVTLAPNSVRRIPRDDVQYCAVTGLDLVAELALAYAPARLSPAGDAFIRVARRR